MRRAGGAPLASEARLWFSHQSDRVVPRTRKARIIRSRCRRLLRTQHVEVRADFDMYAASVSAVVAVVSTGDQKHPGREGVDPWRHLLASGHTARQDSVYRPPRVARSRRVSRLTHATR